MCPSNPFCRLDEVIKQDGSPAFTGARTRKAKGTKGPTGASWSRAFSKASRKAAASVQSEGA